MKLIFQESDKMVEVVKASEQGFWVSDSTATGQVFVYGREVDDFHSVDYEAISMLNVSATQRLNYELLIMNDEWQVLREQLAAADATNKQQEVKLLRVDALEAENAELKATLSNLLKRMEKMEQAAE